MSESKENILSESEFLHQLLRKKMCICDAKIADRIDTILKTLGHDSTLSSPKKDEVLLTLSIFTDLFEARHCRLVQTSCQFLLDHTCFLDVVVRRYV